MTSDAHAAKADKSWAETVQAKRAIRDAHLQKHEQSSTWGSGSKTLGANIVDVEALTNLLKSGQVSAENMIRAYIRR